MHGRDIILPLLLVDGSMVDNTKVTIILVAILVIQSIHTWYLYYNQVNHVLISNQANHVLYRNQVNHVPYFDQVNHVLNCNQVPG